MNSYKRNLLRARDLLGSFDAVGSVCGVSGKAVMKWRDKGSPPRTEYTGETNYAELIEQALNGQVTQHELRPDVINPADKDKAA